MYTFWKKNLFRFYDKKIGKRHYVLKSLLRFYKKIKLEILGE